MFFSRNIVNSNSYDDHHSHYDQDDCVPCIVGDMPYCATILNLKQQQSSSRWTCHVTSSFVGTEWITIMIFITRMCNSSSCCSFAGIHVLNIYI